MFSRCLQYNKKIFVTLRKWASFLPYLKLLSLLSVASRFFGSSICMMAYGLKRWLALFCLEEDMNVTGSGILVLLVLVTPTRTGLLDVTNGYLSG